MATAALERSSPSRLERSLGFAQVVLRHHAWFVLVAGGYAAGVVLLLEALDRPYRLADRFYLATAMLPLVIAGLSVVIGQVIYNLLHVRPFHTKDLLRSLRSDERFRLSRIAYALVPIFVIIVFQSAFTSYKYSITAINPFAYDVLFMEIDRWLHFGTHPWEWLQPIVGYPIATSVISFAYKLWYGVFYLIFFWMAFSMSDPALRARYLLSYLLCWILIGSFAALALSSAGPCFYGDVIEGPDPYAPLMAYLEETAQHYKNWSLIAQQYLWEAYERQDTLEVASGISAMPSMHVAIAALQALFGWQISRRAGILLTGYCVIVMIGSVHLGWHYAIDGYVSVLAVIVIWKAVGWALQYHPSFAWRKESEANAESAEAAAAQ